MAEASISLTQDQLKCPICLDLLKDPVTIPCGHSYCMSCIKYFWNKEDLKRVYSCAQCRQIFSSRPALNKNVVFAEMVEKLKQAKLKSPRPAFSYAGPDDVECNVCTARKRKAVKSCLTCLLSYCQSHFECHEESPLRKRHKVTDATGRIQELICPQHDRPLEVYCRTDQRCICLMCVMDDHKNHDTVPAKAERTEKQKKVAEMQGTLQQETQKRRKKLRELKEAIKTHKNFAQAAVEGNERLFTVIIRYIEQNRSEVTQMIREHEMAEVSRAEELLKRLEQEIEDLKRREAELEQLLHTDVDIHYLQSLQSVSHGSTDNISIISSLSYEATTAVAMIKGGLKDFFDEEKKCIYEKVKGVKIISTNQPRTREEFLKYFHQLTLDPNTANINLSLSKRNTMATRTRTVHAYPEHPDRFDVWPQVLCRESVCGPSYWEVEWRGGVVGISVSYQSMGRKGEFDKFGHNDQSWRLYCSRSKYLFFSNDIRTELEVSSISSKIGVYVDHCAGILSFYSVSDTMTLIHSVQTTFTQPLYPGFLLNYGSSVRVTK